MVKKVLLVFAVSFLLCCCCSLLFSKVVTHLHTLLNFLHFTLIEKASKNGSNIKTWMMWDSFTNGNEKYLVIGELSTSYLENSWDIGNPEFSKTNPIKNLHMLWKYLHHLVRKAQESSIPGNPFSILL